MAALLTVVPGVLPVAQAATTTSVGPVLDEGQGPVGILQFTAAGHVLGFQAHEERIATLEAENRELRALVGGRHGA